ncbi:hypothetical protein H5410_012910 [Solanum commersonii]|uniref:Uncharacterized protein n=1 Tax=Solanum commersonii TaxID=4109 RepID=A0A9J6ATG8_SOLCO|nr:hypothetical protein H5410_012910 [Solanum commersonii]
MNCYEPIIVDPHNHKTATKVEVALAKLYYVNESAFNKPHRQPKLRFNIDNIFSHRQQRDLVRMGRKNLQHDETFNFELKYHEVAL